MLSKSNFVKVDAMIETSNKVTAVYGSIAINSQLAFQRPNRPTRLRRALIISGCTTGLTALVALLGCSGDSSTTPASTPVANAPAPAPAPAPTAPVGNLTVNVGISAASQTPSALLDIFANADAAGMVFDKWTGDTSVLLTPGERRSGTIAFSGDKSVTATYKSLAAFVPQIAVINGAGSSAVSAYWYFPQSLLKGVIFRFHGKGGNGGSQFQKIEESKFVRDAVGDGFAVVSLDSQDRVSKTWDSTVNVSNPSANSDVANILGLINNFKSQNLMTASTPIFGSGHSDGAGAALRFSYLLTWRASHQHDVPGPTQLAQATTVPGIWTMSQNDTREDPSRNASALTNSNILAARNIATQYILMAPSAVYPMRFTQIPTITAADSQAIYNAFKAAGILDANNYQVRDPFDVNFAPLIPAAFSSKENEIVDQLNVAYASHQFQSASNRRVLEFFKSRLP